MKILFPTPVLYDGNDARYLARDGARFAKCLIDHGHRGIKIVLAPETAVESPRSPLLAMGTFRQWLTPDYWRSFGADGALCYFGLSSRRFLPVVRAMMNAGLRLALKMDSPDGVFVRRFPTMLDFSKLFWKYRERFSTPKATFLASASLFRRTICPWRKSMQPFLESFAYITAESPMAVNNTVEWCKRNHAPNLAERVDFLPHPVPDEFMPPCGNQMKRPIVLAVALNWDNPRKGGPIAAGALQRYLNNQSDWSAVVVGQNAEKIAKAAGPRASHFARMSSEQILPLYQSARIFFTPSGFESGPIVVFEAAACGCSIVFPPQLEHLSWILDVGMGTMSKTRTCSSLASALETEAAHWLGNPNRFRNATVPLLTVSKTTERLFQALFELGNHAT